MFQLLCSVKKSVHNEMFGLFQPFQFRKRSSVEGMNTTFCCVKEVGLIKVA